VPVTLNVDLGELAGEPDELYELASMVNVACGGHAGDAASMTHAVKTAKASRAMIAAHPSYPDREGFGRVSRHTVGPALDTALAAQLGALSEVASREGAIVVATKPHGALYHDADRDPTLAAALVEASVRVFPRAVIVGPSGGELERAASVRGLETWREGFADRAYAPDGRLVPRANAGALLTDPERCAEQAVALARSGRFETLCLHGDTPGALANARRVRAAHEAEHLLVERRG
jgi:UPF0271 protein